MNLVEHSVCILILHATSHSLYTVRFEALAYSNQIIIHEEYLLTSEINSIVHHQYDGRNLINHTCIVITNTARIDEM